jgi:hypothetical protein
VSQVVILDFKVGHGFLQEHGSSFRVKNLLFQLSNLPLHVDIGLDYFNFLYSINIFRHFPGLDNFNFFDNLKWYFLNNLNFLYFINIFRHFLNDFDLLYGLNIFRHLLNDFNFLDDLNWLRRRSGLSLLRSSFDLLKDNNFFLNDLRLFLDLNLE